MNLDKSEFFVNQKKHLILKTGADKDDYVYIKHEKIDNFTQRYLEFLFSNYEVDELVKTITYMQQQLGATRHTKRTSEDSSDDISDTDDDSSDDSSGSGSDSDTSSDESES